MTAPAHRPAASSWLARNWFVIAIGAVVALGASCGPALSPIDARLPLAGFIVAIMFVTAIGLPHRDMGRAFRRPGPILMAVALSYTLVPAAGLWLGRIALREPRDLELGMLLVAAAPCTLASAVIWTRLAGGDEATALFVTLTSNLISFLATSAWVSAGTGTMVQLEFAVLMRQLAIVIAIPVGAGQIARLHPAIAGIVTRRKTQLSVIARCLILAVVLSAAVKAGARLRETPLPVLLILRVVLLCALLHLAGWAAAWSLGRFGLRIDRRRAIGAAFGASQKTLPVALYMARSFFPQFGLASLPILIYHVTQLVIDTWIANALARPTGAKRDAAAP